VTPERWRQIDDLLTAVLELEAGVLRARLPVVAEFRGGLGELDSQAVGARLERQR